MKFAKELEQDRIPEWQSMYLDYKAGKKKVKAIARAYRNAEAATPKTPGRRKPGALFNSNGFFSPQRTQATGEVTSQQAAARRPPAPSPLRKIQSSTRGRTNGTPRHTIEEEGSVGDEGANETSPLTQPGGDTTYGSFVPSPPQRPRANHSLVSLELPDPALSASREYLPHESRNQASQYETSSPQRQSRTPQTGEPGTNAYTVGPLRSPSKIKSFNPLSRQGALSGRRTFSSPGTQPTTAKPPVLRRLFSLASPPRSAGSLDVPLGTLKELDIRQAQFFSFLDFQLAKVEKFYREKEEAATHQLAKVKDQLHEMRNRRIEEVQEIRRAKETAAVESYNRKHSLGPLSSPSEPASPESGDNDDQIDGAQSNTSGALQKLVRPIEDILSVSSRHIGKNSRALEQMGPAPMFVGADHTVDRNRNDSWRDFQRRLREHDVPYAIAKRKLKDALIEFYRSLELLKSYSLLNRTAFRKMNKKYDKAVNARPTMRYVSEKVNKAWFVQSEVLDGYIVAVEDLYARYFERGNHKVAVGKLRSKSGQHKQFHGSVFRNGVFTAAGLVFGIQGLVKCASYLNQPDPMIHVSSSYLLQLYGGYFLVLWLFFLFILDCSIWNRERINYVFIFEFDSRHNLDWHELAEWRLILAGLYPVEFRDFFLGDMFCSLTYTMGNIALIPCLYIHHWNDPAQCNSSHSRVLGFFAALPGIWRALQCLRRYKDTRNAFPHLVNCGKYICTILSYTSLSLYRIHRYTELKALFIVFSFINSVYTSIWDIWFDWSLGQANVKQRFLRDVRGYKQPWVYYVAMVIDPVLRFNWIFYVIFTGELQHSAVLSFLISFTEICRRGLWTIFRVENEHCTNVGKFRASKDVPLPYDLGPTPPTTAKKRKTLDGVDDDYKVPPVSAAMESLRPLTSGADVERSASATTDPSIGTLRRRATAAADQPQSGIARVGTIMAQAHAQDFERKRKPPLSGMDVGDGQHVQDSDESSDEDKEIEVEHSADEEISTVGAILSRHRSATEGGTGAS
ncbi:hypothetical protein MMC25_006694 [Agyrium rufum]|nr:hypothetical protein [Agyrium rufum]